MKRSEKSLTKRAGTGKSPSSPSTSAASSSPCSEPLHLSSLHRAAAERRLLPDGFSSPQQDWFRTVLAVPSGGGTCGSPLERLCHVIYSTRSRLFPACSPGMLQGSDGLPLTTAPEDYPLRIVRDGILVDDPDHTDDIMRRVREVLEVIWKDRAEAIEKEACEILGVKELRDYFRKPGKGGFWDDHVSRYSKSRRKAPIYWLLQSAKKNYALWLYYHRLDKDMLFKALVNYVEPKIRLEDSRLDTLRTQKPPLAAGPSGPSGSARMSSGRKSSSPNCGTSRTSCAGRRTCTSNRTSTMASS